MENQNCRGLRLVVNPIATYVFGCATVTSAILNFLNRYFPRKTKVVGSFDFRSALDVFLPTMIVICACAVMYLSSQVEGIQGPPGERGVAGPPGGVSPQLRDNLIKLEKQLADLQDQIKKVSLAAEFIKAKDCEIEIPFLENSFNNAYSKLQSEVISPPKFPPYPHIQSNEELFKNAIDKLFERHASCYPNAMLAGRPSFDIKDEELDSKATGEPIEDYDKKRKYRRNAIRYERVLMYINGWRSLDMNSRVNAIKDEIDK